MKATAKHTLTKSDFWWCGNLFMHHITGRSSPRCRTARTSVWGRSRRSDSRRRSPCSRCWERSGRSFDHLHSAGSDTDRCCGRSDSLQMMDSWRGRCQAGCKHTLWTRTRLHQDLSKFWMCSTEPLSPFYGESNYTNPVKVLMTPEAPTYFYSP